MRLIFVVILLLILLLFILKCSQHFIGGWGRRRTPPNPLLMLGETKYCPTGADTSTVDNNDILKKIAP
jgi:hypothetical protein